MWCERWDFLHNKHETFLPTPCGTNTQNRKTERAETQKKTDASLGDLPSRISSLTTLLPPALG